MNSPRQQNPTIERGIPIPVTRTHMAHLLATMSSGDSIVVSRSEEMNWRYYARNKHIRLRGRKISETKMRLWRL